MYPEVLDEESRPDVGRTTVAVETDTLTRLKNHIRDRNEATGRRNVTHDEIIRLALDKYEQSLRRKRGK